MVPSLLDIALAALLSSIQKQDTLGKLPEHLALELFEGVLASGKLTPQVLVLFVATQHAAVLERIAMLNIQTPPPVLKTGRMSWLGDNSRLF